jgi:hypothetical protein
MADPVDPGAGIFAQAGQWVSALWTRLSGFNERRRTEVLLWLSAQPRKLLWPALGLLAVGAVLLLRRYRRVPAAVRAYRRALRKRRQRLLPGETPRQLAARVPELAHATAAHERARYGAR